MAGRWTSCALVAVMAGCGFDPSGGRGGGGGDSDDSDGGGLPDDDAAPGSEDAAVGPDGTPAPACEAPWVEEATGCYQYVKDITATFEGAQADCAGRGGHLVVEDAPDEYLAVAAGMAIGDLDRFWIGLHDPAPDDNVFVWVTGEALADTHWAGTEPSNSGDCVNARADGTWGDRSCAELKWFACEKND